METDSRLEARIGHVFKTKALLARALTHVSALGTDAVRVESYQRLEFLGDRVLGLVVAEMLHTAFPEAEEGELSRRLADMVRKESCSEVAQEWGAGQHLRLGEGEAQTGGARKSALLADIGRCLARAPAAIAPRVAVTQFHRLRRALRGARGHRDCGRDA